MALMTTYCNPIVCTTIGLREWEITTHVNQFQDKLIVQGNENISTIIQKDHKEFSQEKQELEQTLYHRAQYF